MDIKYSIDMVRLKAEIPVKVLDLLVMKPFGTEPNVSYAMKTSISSYRHNFFIKGYDVWGCECSYWLGASHNSRKHSDHADIVLEYNPNKCEGEPILEYLFDNIYRDNNYVEVKSFDIAIDVPVNISELNVSAKGNMTRRVFDNGSDDKTFYFRKGKSNGAIKIYNKKRESKLNYELTRYEITLVPNLYIDLMPSYDVPVDLFVPLRGISSFQMPISVSGTDKILLLACMEHPEYLKDLGRDKRKKIEQLLAENCSIDFDFDKISFVVRSFFKSIYTL